MSQKQPILIDLTVNDAMPETPPVSAPSWMTPGLAPYPYQWEAASWVRARFAQDPGQHHGMCGGVMQLDMGLGKTLVSLMALLGNEEATGPVLIVCPKLVLTSWLADLTKFVTPEVRAGAARHLVLHPDHLPASRLASLTPADLRAYGLVLTTYETLCASYKHDSAALDAACGIVEADDKDDAPARPRALRHRRVPLAVPEGEKHGKRVLHAFPWSCVVLDESHHAANLKSVTFKAAMAISAPRTLLLTGTPFRNYNTDFLAQLCLLGFGHEDLTTVRDWNRNATHWMQALSLQAAFFTRTYAQAGITLPPQHDETRWVELSDEERPVYEAFEQLMADRFHEHAIYKGSFAYVLAALGLMRRACTAAALADTRAVYAGHSILPTEEGAAAPAAARYDAFIGNHDGRGGVGSSKMQALLAALRDCFSTTTGGNGGKVIVFSMFASALHLAQRLLSVDEPAWTVLLLDGRVTDLDERAAILRAFRAPSAGPVVLLLSGKVGGEGLTLIEADAGILFEPHWTRADEMQQRRRLHRIGQTKPTRWIRLVVRDSIEDFVLEVGAAKLRLESALRGGPDDVQMRQLLGDFLRARKERIEAGQRRGMKRAREQPIVIL